MLSKIFFKVYSTVNQSCLEICIVTKMLLSFPCDGESEKIKEIKGASLMQCYATLLRQPVPGSFLDENTNLKLLVQWWMLFSSWLP